MLRRVNAHAKKATQGELAITVPSDISGILTAINATVMLVDLGIFPATKSLIAMIMGNVPVKS